MIPASISRWALPRQPVDPAQLFTAVPIGDDTYHLVFGDGSGGRATRKGWANLHPIQAGFAYHRGLTQGRYVRELGWYGDEETVEAFEVLIRHAQHRNPGRLWDWWRFGFFGGGPS